jgi:hypothetical protein
LHREEHLHFLVYLHAANALSRGHRSIRRTGTYISQKPHNSHSLPQKQEQHISDILVSCRGSHLTACSHVTATSAPASSAFCVHATIQKAPVISATPCGGFRHEPLARTSLIPAFLYSLQKEHDTRSAPVA